MDQAILNYCGDYTSPESPILRDLNRETHLSQVYPQMLSGHLQGMLLQMISQMIRPRRILEIGTFTGYSAICLAAGCSAGILHTIERNPELEELIRKYLNEASLTDSVVLHIGEATEIIPSLTEEWDLVFIDADKPNYSTYYNLVMPQLRPGGFILADNVLWDGKVLEPPETWDKDTRGIVAFNELVRDDERVENLLLPVRDGLMMIRKREES